MLDDLFTYRLAECHFLIVTNAANHERDLAWLRSHATDLDVDVIDRQAEFAMLAVQGPGARALVRSLSDGPLPARMHCCERAVAGSRCSSAARATPARTESSCCWIPSAAPAVWDALLAAGAAPVGLGARDTLRLEACFHLYGNDLTEDRGPIEAGLGWCCAERTGFIGSDAVASVRAAGPVREGSCRS